MTTPKLRRIGYQAYEIATGPAAGTVLAHTDNPTALPCYRWQVVRGGPLGTLGMGSTDGFTLHGLAAAIDAAARESARKA